MYKVIIVDDENPIRKGLITYVNWAEMGFSVAGEASNGNDAIELIRELKPHVVLTDIKMPRCTGIELMEKIKKDNIDIKIVVLSGYDEFEYAKAALKAGAVDYLLKPIEFDKLNEIFIKIKNEYDKRNKEEIQNNRVYSLLKEQFQYDFTNGGIEKEDIHNIENKLILLIKQYNSEGISKLIQDTFNKFSGKADVYNCYISFIKILNRFLEASGIKSTDIIDKKSVDFDRLMNRETVQDVTAELMDVFKNVIEYLGTRDFKYTNKIIEAVKKYIIENYSNNISLEMAANSVHMNHMYLSRLFKKETGVSFTDYLTDIRMQKAKKLMENVSIKLYEISEMVGYYSPKHFSKVFKKNTGVTPKQYRNNVIGYSDKRPL